MDFNNEIDLRSQEEKLSDEERLALAGYMRVKDTIKEALPMAYKMCHKPSTQKGRGVLQEKIQKWIQSPPVKSFIILYKHFDDNGAPENGKNTSDIEKNETEVMLEELDALQKNECESVDDKVKVIKLKADIRHKNRVELQTDNNMVKYYLPQRCNEEECELYAAALRRERILHGDDNKQTQ